MPHCIFMKRSSHFRKPFSHHEEKEPHKQNRDRALTKADEICKPGAACEWFVRKLLEAGGAEHTVVVLGDAFAAEEPGAFRAARDSFPVAMV